MLEIKYELLKITEKSRKVSLKKTPHILGELNIFSLARDKISPEKYNISCTTGREKEFRTK